MTNITLSVSFWMLLWLLIATILLTGWGLVYTFGKLEDLRMDLRTVCLRLRKLETEVQQKKIT